MQGENAVASKYEYLSNTPLDEAVSCYLDAVDKQGIARRSGYPVPSRRSECQMATEHLQTIGCPNLRAQKRIKNESSFSFSLFKR